MSLDEVAAMPETRPFAKLRAHIYCTHRRKWGDKGCGHLLGIMEADAFVGVIRIKCPKCGEITEFT